MSHAGPPSRQKARSDPFKVLGLPWRFDLQESEIEAAFLARLGGVHPDLVGEEGSMDAATLTEARSLLADPEARANALLSLLGGPDASEDKGLPDEFLMEIMELRGAIEEELAEGERAREKWESFSEERRAEHIARVSDLFRSAGSDPGSAELHEIRVELNAWRYTERLIEQLDPGYDPRHSDFSG